MLPATFSHALVGPASPPDLPPDATRPERTEAPAPAFAVEPPAPAGFDGFDDSSAGAKETIATAEPVHRRLNLPESKAITHAPARPRTSDAVPPAPATGQPLKTGRMETRPNPGPAGEPASGSLPGWQARLVAIQNDRPPAEISPLRHVEQDAPPESHDDSNAEPVKVGPRNPAPRRSASVPRLPLATRSQEPVAASGEAPSPIKLVTDDSGRMAQPVVQPAPAALPVSDISTKVVSREREPQATHVRIGTIEVHATPVRTPEPASSQLQIHGFDRYRRLRTYRSAL
jgi:hypothetical protein